MSEQRRAALQRADEILTSGAEALPRAVALNLRRALVVAEQELGAREDDVRDLVTTLATIKGTLSTMKAAALIDAALETYSDFVEAEG